MTADRRGWFKVHRGWMASFKPEPFTDREAFLWSIEQAAHAPHEQWFNGTRYLVDRGEFVTSLHAMMAAFGWSEKRVRGLMERMGKAEKWAKRGANAGAKAPTVLSVLNYSLYQGRPDEEGEVEGEASGEEGAKQGRSEGEEQKNSKNSENGKEGKEREASPPRSPNLPYAEAVHAWTQAAQVAGWKPFKPELTDKRRRGLAKILKAHGLDGWIADLQRALDSPLLNPTNGHDPPAWFNFNFISNPDNYLKLHEGNYAKQFTGSHEQRSSGWLDANASLGGAFRSAVDNLNDAPPVNGGMGLPQSSAGALTR